MKIIDLTYTLTNEIKEYPGDPKTNINYFKKGNKNDSCSLFKFETGMHTGTHIDAPHHYFLGGKKINEISIENFIGKTEVYILDTISKNHEISIENFKPTNKPCEIIMIITGWSNNFGSYKYFYENPYISNELADMLIEKNVKGVAIDTCSVDKFGENKIHEKFLKENIWICENITNTNKLKENIYEGYFIPLNINTEASPARAFVKKI